MLDALMQPVLSGTVIRAALTTGERVLDIGCGTGANTFDALEKAKLVFGEKLQNAGKPQRSFEEMFQLACDFLSGLWDIWKNGD